MLNTTRRPLISWWLYMVVAVSNASIQTKTTLAFTLASHANRHKCIPCHLSKNADGDDEDSQNISGLADSISNLDMKTFQERKQKLILQSQQQRWYQPPNPLLEDPVEFVQAILVALQEHKKKGAWNGALCLLRSSTPSWRKLLLKSVGAPPDATNDQVAPTLQTALERSNNQFEILTRNLDEETMDVNGFTTTISSVQKCWDFPSDPVLFEEDDKSEDESTQGERITDHCWIESRLRSPTDNQLLAVVGWSLQRRRIIQEDQSYNSSNFESDTENDLTCWLLDGIDWQDFRDEFRPGIGREEWERICG